MFRLLGLLLFTVLSSCVVGPNYVKPPVLTPPQFKEAQHNKAVIKKEWKMAQPSDQVNRGEWWTIFRDPRLNQLENELNCYNQNIANAVANYYQARAIVDEARASYFPTLTGIIALTRQRQGGSASFVTSTASGTSAGTVTTSAAGIGATINSYSAFLNANWEPDWWGLVRRTVEADVAAAQSNQALVEVTRLSAQSALAQYYFELKTLDKDQQLLNDTVSAYHRTLQFTKNQYRSGIVSQADVIQAKSLLESAKANAINNGILRGQYEHAIAVLTGKPPAQFSLSFMPLITTPPQIPLTLPSSLLERRPDIAQAERLMQEANAKIGIAIAGYFPVVNLSGTLGVAGNNIPRLFNASPLAWSIGTQIAETIFDGGFRNAAVRAAKASYMAQIAAYRQTVLSACQEVEDHLLALRLLKEQSIQLKLAASDAKKALNLVFNQYKAGTTAYSNVLLTQITYYSAQKAANDGVGLEMTAAIGLIKSLGGSWHVNLIQPV